MRDYSYNHPVLFSTCSLQHVLFCSHQLSSSAVYSSWRQNRVIVSKPIWKAYIVSCNLDADQMSLAPAIHVTPMQLCVVNCAVVLISCFQLTLVGINFTFRAPEYGSDKLSNLVIRIPIPLMLKT